MSVSIFRPNISIRSMQQGDQQITNDTIIATKTFKYKKYA